MFRLKQIRMKKGAAIQIAAPFHVRFQVPDPTPCITGSKALLILMSMQNLVHHLGLENTSVGVGFVTESAGNRHKPIYVQQFRVPFPSGLPG